MRVSLRQLITLVMLVLGIVIVTAPPLLNLQAGLKRSEVTSERYLRELMGQIVSDLERANRYGAARLPANHLRTLTRYRAVEDALVVDPDNKVAHSTDFAILGSDLSNTTFTNYVNEIERSRLSRNAQIVRSGNFLIGAAPVDWTLQTGELLPSRSGSLLIRYNMSEQIFIEQRNAANTAFILIAGVLLCTGLAIWFFQRVIGRDVSALEATARSVAERRKTADSVVRLREFHQIQVEMQKTRQLLLTQFESLEQSEERFRDIVENSSEWIFEADAGGQFQYSNDVVAQILGISAEQIVGRKLEEFVNQKIENLKLFETLNMRTRFHDVVLELVHSSGELRRVRFSGARRKSLGATIHVVASDITPQDRMQEALIQSQKMDAIGQLAGGIAHDFNNVLTVILNMCEMTVSEFKLDKEVAAQINAIRDQALGASQLTKRLATVSRQHTAAPRLLELNGAIHRAERLLESAAGALITIEYDLCSAPLPVLFDPVELEQILLNFVINAKNAMEKGGSIRVITALRNGLPGEGVNQVAELKVSDTGSGIDPAILGRIFEPFFSTRGEGEGMGLGLASVKRNIGAANGSIEVESTVEKGATFTVRLPISLGTVDYQVSAKLDDAPTGVGRRVLVVDDQDQIRQLIAKYLRNLEYEVAEADSVAAALRMIDAQEFDLVISDVQLKDGNGIEMISRCSPSPRALFISGHMSPESATQTTLEEGRNFINKPFRLNDLAAAVARAIGNEQRASERDSDTATGPA